MTKARLRYQTVEFGETDIHICSLRDKQQYSDPDGAAEKLGISSASWPLFGVLWPSGMVLAHYINDYDTGALRILEVGCGMALASMVLNKQEADITATDHHPEVETFLLRNALLNQGAPIDFERVDWAETSDELGLFDLIIGSDLLYEDAHVDLLAEFIERHAEPRCEVVLVDPGRGRKSKLSTRMIEFGFTSEHIKPKHTEYLEKEFNGYILKFKRTNAHPNKVMSASPTPTSAAA